MKKDPFFVASALDLASLNIMENIISLRNKDMKVININNDQIKKIYDFKDFKIVYINEENIYQDELDRKLEQLGFKISYMIFLSRHKSKSEIKALTVHSTGNYGDIFYGGNNYKELSIPFPILMSSLLQYLYEENNHFDLKSDVTLEITHHGPTRLNVPSFFVEIGSNEVEWKNKLMGLATSNALLNLIKNENNLLLRNRNPNVVGFGGSHYANIQTKLTLENKFNFGHIFPKYQINNLTDETIEESFIKSNATSAYIDKKSIRSETRKKLIDKIKKLDYNVIL